jgi:hypothetical protein
MKKLCSISLALVATLYLASNAFAYSTLVQFSTTGNGSYDISQIAVFDWSSLGSAVIEQNLVSSTSGSTTTAGGTLAGFFLTATPGDTLTMTLHAQAKLGNFLDVADNSLNSNGTNTFGTDYEVTTTLDATETAVLNNDGTISFTSINGSYQFFFDTTPDANVDAGTGYNDGVDFLSGSIVATSGSFDPNAVTQSGKGLGISNLTNTIDSYDTNYINTDPTSPGVVLSDTEFTTTLHFGNTTVYTNVVDPGGQIGGDGTLANPAYKPIGATDLILSADASNGFSAVPEPTTMLLFGTGLIGLAGLKRKRS